MGLAITNLHVDLRFTKTSATRKMNWQVDRDSSLHFKKLEFWYQCIAIKWPSAMIFAIPFSVEKAEKWKCAWHNPNLQTQILFLHFLQCPHVGTKEAWNPLFTILTAQFMFVSTFYGAEMICGRVFLTPDCWQQWSFGKIKIQLRLLVALAEHESFRWKGAAMDSYWFFFLSFVNIIYACL